MDVEQRQKIWAKALEDYREGRLKPEDMNSTELRATYQDRYSCGDLTDDEMAAV